jgi:signal transduction histidine kinase
MTSSDAHEAPRLLRLWRTLERALVRDVDTYAPEVRQRIDIVIGLALITVPVHLLRGLSFLASSDHLQASLHFAALLLALASLGPLRGGRWKVTGNLLVFSLVFPGHGLALRTTGYESPELTTLLFIPFLGTLVGGSRAGLGWAVATSALMLAHAIHSRIPWTGGTGIAWPVPLMMATPFAFYAVSLVYEWAKERAFEARRSAERLQLAVEEEARLLRADRMVAMGTLVASVAHEINNPLTYVMTNVELVRSELANTGPAAKQWVEDLDQAALGLNRIRTIVADLQSYTRANDAESDCSIAETVAASARIAAAQIRGVGKLDVDIPEGLPRVHMREGHLGQVVLNLLINAVHAMDAAHRARNVIRIEAQTTGAGDVELRVVDNGGGMTEEVRARALEALFTTKAAGVGTGLGLFVCNKIVRDLGGSLEIESRAGEGTTVRIVIPRNRVVPIDGPERASGDATM